MKRSLYLLLSLIMLFAVWSPAMAASPHERVIVLFKDKVDKRFIESANGTILREYTHVPALAVSVPPQALQGLKNNPNVQQIEKDVVVQLNGQIQDWGIEQVRAPEAWNLTYTGKNVKIAVVDTGIASHEDLTIAGGASFTSYTTSYQDDNGHGTHIGGIIGARNNDRGVIGAAHDSQLYAVKVLDSNGSGYLSDVVAGIDWSITNQMDIINLSLGTSTHSTTLQEVVDKAYNHGILVVAAAGNNGNSDGSGDTVEYPARYTSAIAVAATDSSNTRASFSATGETIEVAAPGVSIASTYLDNGYVYMSGTSMATPYAAATLALLKEAYPTHSASQLRSLLQEGVVDLGATGKDTFYGHGLVQAPTTAPVAEPTTEETTTEETTTTEPAITYETRTSVATDKSSYKAGETVYITIRVTDQDNNVLAGAAVNTTITPPKGKKLVNTATTNANGEVVLKLSTTKRSAKGTYQVQSDSTLDGYTSSSASTSFDIY
jgi:minor extracellular protease Epr